MTKVFQLLDDELQEAVDQEEGSIRRKMNIELTEAMLKEGIELSKIKRITGLSMKTIKIIAELFNIKVEV